MIKAKIRVPRWGNHYNTLSNKRLSDNLSLVERNQKIRADSIIEKHRGISLRNQMMKERRDQLYFDHKSQSKVEL